MALRKAQTLETVDLTFHDKVSGNPFLSGAEGGALENFYYDHGKLVRVSFMPPFNSSAASSNVWKIIPFRFTRDGAPELQLLYVKANGKIYKRSGGSEQEIFPAETGFSALVAKPSYTYVRNRLMISDGAQVLFWDGWTWVAGGLDAPTGFSGTNTTPTGADGSLTTNGVYSICITAVHQRTNGSTTTRIHESNRTDVSTETAAATNHITVTTSGVTFPSRATHWSIYMSELDGSAIYRRVATLPITTTTHDITAEPSATAPIAPERNDPVQPSKVLCSWKNRVAMRSETNKSQFWFTAFGEVSGLLNGAGEECLPGRIGSSSLSDLVNEWDIPDGTDIRGIVYHEDFLWVFSRTAGYLIRGEGTLLDNRSLRDFYPQKQFSFGCAGPAAICSTPYGLVVMSPEKKLWLWDGSAEVRDIGYDVQDRLSALTSDQLEALELLYWSGDGFDWLLVNLPDRIQLFDMASKSQQNPDGVWFTIDNSLVPSSFGIYNNGRAYLLAGYTDGSVHQVGDFCQPAHLGLSFTLGTTYLGSAAQDNLDGLLTYLDGGKPSEWQEAKYMEMFVVSKVDETSTGATTIYTAPTVTAYYDDINPQTPNGTANSQTVSLVGRQSDVTLGYPYGFRVWFSKSSGSSSGVLCKHFQVSISLTTTVKTGTRNRSSQELLEKICATKQPRAKVF